MTMARQATEGDGKAYPDNRSQIVAFGEVLRATEWLSTEELRSYQQPLITKLVRHTRKNTAFYRERLREGLLEIGEKSWLEIPVLTRAEAVKNNLKISSRKTPREAGVVIGGRTAGSTGTPFALKKTR